MKPFQTAVAATFCALAALALPTHAQAPAGAGNGVVNAPGAASSVLRATELRADKLPGAAVLAPLAPGASLRVISIEGGWVYVEAAGRLGWVRASALNLSAGSSLAALQDNGRQATLASNTAMTLGVRSLPARSNRHALIIGISHYADPNTPALPGAKIDRESATQMALAMQVPKSNITYLQDEQATGDNIRAAIKALNEDVLDGDKVFIHYSGHGTRFQDTQAGGCVEALLAYDGGWPGTITNREMAELLKPITNKTDKLMVMYDACHSGGIVANASTVRTRGISIPGDEGKLRPKFASISEECGKPSNVKTRNLVVEAQSKGALPQDIIHISAARDNEISFDDEQKGGLATEFMRDCMLRDAKDLDGSGAISVEEIRMCAQDKLNNRMQNDPSYKAHNITLSGNTGFVPAWFSQGVPAAPAMDLASVKPVAMPAMPANAASAAIKPVAVAEPAPLSGAQALQQMFAQRDAKRNVRVTVGKEKLKIGQDYLDFSVQSERAGYVYVALAGSDNKALYLLFPNALDANNKIQAGQTLALPRSSWRVKAQGPAGSNNLLVIVADSPRDLGALAAGKEGPFMTSLNDAQGRAQLGALMSSASAAASSECATPAARKNNALCSDAYGAASFAIEELR